MEYERGTRRRIKCNYIARRVNRSTSTPPLNRLNMVRRIVFKYKLCFSYQ